MKRIMLAVLMGMTLTYTVNAAAIKDGGEKGQPKIYGMTYGEWSAKWWQWALAGPEGENAVQDETGEFCAVNQPKGKVWFLAGSLGLTGVERTCTIPRKRALFYPPVTQLWTDCPGTPDEDLTDAEVRNILTTLAGGDPACQLTSTLDGAAISTLQILTVRTQSPTFTILLPENHIPVGGCEPALPAGETGRSISEGYWVMLPPLSPGEHVLTLHGAACDPVTGAVLFENGVTYHLTVLGGGAHEDD
jgi:hypothetical protein